MARAAIAGRHARGAPQVRHACEAGLVRRSRRRRRAGLDGRHDVGSTQRRRRRAREEVPHPGRGTMIRWLALLLICAPLAQAHEMTMAELELREVQHGDFLWQWTASGSVPAE